MSLSRRGFLQTSGLAAGTLLVPALAACGGDGGAAKQVTSGKVTVNTWMNSQQLIDIFKHWGDQLGGRPGATLQYAIAPFIGDAKDVTTKALAAYSAKGAIPDLVGLEINSFPRFATGGIAASTLLDLTDKVKNGADDFYRWEPYEVKGRRYGVETAYPLVVYYYRDDLFTKFGISPEIATWEEMLKVGGRVHSKHGVSLGVIGQPSSGDTTWFQMLFLQRGGQFYDEEGNLTLDGPEAVETMQFMADAVRNGTFLVVSDFYGGPGAAALKQGKTAGYFMPDWFNSFILQPSAPDQAGKWRMRVLPKFTAGGHSTSVAGGTGISISKNSPAADATWELLKQAYLTEEGQVWRFKKVGYLPTMKKTWANPELNAFTDKYLGGQEIFKIFKSVADDAPTLRTAANWPVVGTELGNALQSVIAGKATATQAVKNAVAAIGKKS